MSAPQTSPDRQVIVAAVLVLSALGIGVKSVVSRPGRHHTRAAQVRVQAAQPLPADLTGIRQAASPYDGDLAVWKKRSRPRLRRDPFGGDGGNSGQTEFVTGVSGAGGSRPLAAGAQALTCQAVMFGGGRPTALVNDRRYQVGDHVGELRVVVITKTGVKLVDHAGTEQFLSVRTSVESTGRGRIVNERIRARGLGSTSLVEHTRGERK